MVTQLSNGSLHQFVAGLTGKGPNVDRLGLVKLEVGHVLLKGPKTGVNEGCLVISCLLLTGNEADVGNACFEEMINDSDNRAIEVGRYTGKTVIESIAVYEDQIWLNGGQFADLGLAKFANGNNGIHLIQEGVVQVVEGAD